MKKIFDFLELHHLLNISTCKDNLPHCANCFYAFDKATCNFIIASDKSTKHIEHILENPNFSATIALETKEIGKIQGLQFNGIVKKATFDEKKIYLKKHPYAIALNPTLWTLHVEGLKFTDNRLGFGKKLKYKRGEEDKFVLVD